MGEFTTDGPVASWVSWTVEWEGLWARPPGS